MTPSYLPTEQQEQCLRAALLPGEPALLAWRQLIATAAVAQLDAGARSVLPLAYRNLAAAGAGDGDGVEALKAQYLRAWSENQRAIEVALPLVRALDEARIDAVVLKGLAMIARFYRDAGARPMADVDVLVRPADVSRARDAATGLGWRPRYELTAGFRRVKHAGPFDHPAGVACDLHWRLFEESGAARADAELWAAAQWTEFQGARLRVLSPTDQLLHACGHAGRWDAVPGIRWVADAVTILREAPIDWTRFLSQTAERRFVLRMRRMLGYLRRAFGADVPAAVEMALVRAPVSVVERLEHAIRTREHRLLGELPTYVFNCLRGERQPLLAFPGYLRDAWGLISLRDVGRHAAARAGRRLRAVMRGTASRTPRAPDS